MGRERDAHGDTGSSWRDHAHAALDVVLDRLELSGFGAGTHGFDLVYPNGKPMRGVLMIAFREDIDGVSS